MDNYDRQLLALDDTELEKFVREWVHRKSAYVEVTRFSGPNDLGRDVVGFLSTAKHEGPWHNYQCKQYGGTVPTAKGMLEVGKILYHAHKREFLAPTEYFFVAPRGVNRNLERLIYNPTLFRETFLLQWDNYCASKIIPGTTIRLDAGLRESIEAFDFSRVKRLKLDDILTDPDVKPVLQKWFGADPGPPPKGITPAEVQDSELRYIAQLVDAYSERAGVVFSDHQEVAKDSPYGFHLSRQRERYYDADAFKRFYRDNTDRGVLETFEADIMHGVIETCNALHNDSLARVDAVMAQAANVQPAGPLANHARVPVKQGVCHHFANEDQLKWRQ